MLRSSKLSVFSFAFEYYSGRSRCSIAKMSQGVGFENMLNPAEQLLWDADRFKQRAGAEMLAGITRGMATLALIKFECGLTIDNIGAKNWPKQRSDELWSWVISRLDRIYASIKPDTIGFWEATFSVSLYLAIRLTAVKPLHKALLEGRDPRRVPALSDWILSLPLDFYGDSAFASMYNHTNECPMVSHQFN